jgi:hypothetical protein
LHMGGDARASPPDRRQATAGPQALPPPPMAPTTTASAEIDAAIRAAAAEGRVICRVAPPEFHVRTGGKQDEWADWSEITARIAWSTNRVGDIIRRMPRYSHVNEGMANYIAGGYLRNEMGLKLRQELIAAAAAEAGVDITPKADGKGYVREVTIHSDRIVFWHRFPLGD